VAWVVILGLVAFILWRNAVTGERTRRSGDEVGLVFQGRLLVAMREFKAQPGTQKELDNLGQSGTYRQRLLVAILVAEMDGPVAAGDYLGDLEALRAKEDYQPTPGDQRLRETLEGLYNPDPQEPDAEERAALEHRGWLGRLALSHRPDATPEEGMAVRAEATRSVIFMVLLLLFGFLLGLAGCFLLLVFVVLWLRGRLRWVEAPRGGGGLYAETFAVWFFVFLALSYLARWVPFLDNLAGSGVVAVAAVLLALAYPVLRGRDWPTVRGEIGLHSGKSIGEEMLAGVATYAVCLPLIVVAALVIAGMMNWYSRWEGPPASPFAPSNRPSHPVAEMVLGSIWTLISIYWAASVAAPFAEEIAFRGFLQRHLRGFLGRLSTGVAVGLIFAIIHPQGIFGVPALLTLAVIFSLAREWRGSLIAPMVAHALNNAVATTLMIVATR
jgi:membrane protease YdiL (CAAX protease family)